MAGEEGFSLKRSAPAPDFGKGGIMRKPYTGPTDPEELNRMYENRQNKETPEAYKERLIEETLRDDPRELESDLEDPETRNLIGEERATELMRQIVKRRFENLGPSERAIIDQGPNPIFEAGQYIPSSQRALYDYVKSKGRMPSTDSEIEEVFGPGAVEAEMGGDVRNEYIGTIPYNPRQFERPLNDNELQDIMDQMDQDAIHKE